jgi:hypothetical protein
MATARKQGKKIKVAMDNGPAIKTVPTAANTTKIFANVLILLVIANSYLFVDEKNFIYLSIL